MWGHPSSPPLIEAKQCSASPWICTPAARSSEDRGTRRLCGAHVLPSHGPWQLLKLLLAAEGADNLSLLAQSPLCSHCSLCPDWLPKTKGSCPLAPQAASQRAEALSPCPAPLENSTALEMPQPGTDRKGSLFLSPPLGHSTEHTSPSQQHTRLFKRKHNSLIYFTQSGFCHFYTPQGLLCFVLTPTAHHRQHGHC